MNAEQDRLDDLIRTVASRWEHLGAPHTRAQLLAHPVLVLGPDGTTPVARPDFLAAVTARAQAVAKAPMLRTSLAGATAQAFGERMVMATSSWTIDLGTDVATLVSDFLLQREEPDTLRCVAYLPRTNVLDHLPGPETT